MIVSRNWDLGPDPRGRECHVYGFFKLWVDGGEDPALEGDDPHELELEARELGAVEVFHWYHGGRDHNPDCDCERTE